MVLCFLITDVRVELRHAVLPWLPHQDYLLAHLLSVAILQVVLPQQMGGGILKH